jgi:hypothetical protein
LEINTHVTPSGSLDNTPPEVTVVSPNGAESFDAETIQSITWSATDASGISHVDIYMSEDNGISYKPVAKGEASDEPYGWFVPNLPGSQTLIRVAARDNAGNYGFDDSDSPFTIVAVSGGAVPTTLPAVPRARDDCGTGRPLGGRHVPEVSYARRLAGGTFDRHRGRHDDGQGQAKRSV